MDRLVLFADRESDPLLPGYWTDMVLTLDFEAGGHVGGHHAERLLRRAHIDGLPVAVEHQHGRFRQYVHKNADKHRPWAVRCLLFVEIGADQIGCHYAPALPVSETGVQTSTLSGNMVAREGAAPPIAGCRPAVFLFHHRAETGCRGWIRTNVAAFK